jgi:DNA-binding response OmpR family regulator
LPQRQQPDVAVVILDLMIPGMLGQEVCRRLRASSSVPVLMLTARTAEADRITGWSWAPMTTSGSRSARGNRRARAGAGTAHADGDGTPPAPLRVGDVELDGFSRQVRVAGRPVALTRTEFRLLEALFSQPGRTFTRDELVARAFGPDYEGTDRTIDTHITNLRRKLEPTSRGTSSPCTASAIAWQLQTHDQPSHAPPHRRRRGRHRVRRDRFAAVRQSARHEFLRFQETERHSAAAGHAATLEVVARELDGTCCSRESWQEPPAGWTRTRALRVRRVRPAARGLAGPALRGARDVVARHENTVLLVD